MRDIVSLHLTPEKIVSLAMESDAEILCVTHYGIRELHILSGNGDMINRNFLMLSRGSIPDNAKYIGTLPVEIPQSHGALTTLHVFELIEKI